MQLVRDILRVEHEILLSCPALVLGHSFLHGVLLHHLHVDVLELFEELFEGLTAAEELPRGLNLIKLGSGDDDLEVLSRVGLQVDTMDFLLLITIVFFYLSFSIIIVNSRLFLNDLLADESLAWLADHQLRFVLRNLVIFVSVDPHA